MKKIAIILLFFILTGCTDYKEAEKLSLVTAIAIDKVDDEIRVITEVCKFKKDSSEVFYIESFGKSYTEAVSEAIKITGNELYFSHAQVMILGEELVADGIYQIIDIFNRNLNLRLDMGILVAKDASAKEILTTPPQIDDISGLEIKNIIQSTKLVSEIPPMPVYELIDNLSTEGISGSLPVISLSKNYNGDNIREISGFALLKEDYLYAILDENQTKTLSILTNKAKSGNIVNEYTKETPTYTLLDVNSKITPKLENNELFFDFSVDFSLKIDELNTKENILDPKVLKRLEEDIKLALNKDIYDLIIFQINNSESDFLGLGNKVFRAYPSYFESNKNNFNEIIKNLNFDLSVNVSIESSGNMLKSIEIKE